MTMMARKGVFTPRRQDGCRKLANARLADDALGLMAAAVCTTSSISLPITGDA